MGTVIRALAAGVPLVSLPMGRDQLYVAARVVHRGAGVRRRPGAKPATLGAAVRRVIRDPGFRIAARSLGARMAADARAQRGVAALEALAIRRAPD